jgi:hypothetical protein
MRPEARRSHTRANFLSPLIAEKYMTNRWEAQTTTASVEADNAKPDRTNIHFAQTG